MHSCCLGTMADNIIQVYFSLLRAGLWEQDARLSSFEPIDYAGVFRIAQEQSF